MSTFNIAEVSAFAQARTLNQCISQKSYQLGHGLYTFKYLSLITNTMIENRPCDFLTSEKERLIKEAELIKALTH
jgi:hypothetical protein